MTEMERSLHDAEITAEPLIVTNVFLIAWFTFSTRSACDFFSLLTEINLGLAYQGSVRRFAYLIIAAEKQKYSRTSVTYDTCV